MGDAIALARGQWPRLLVFLTDGRTEIDNKQIENAIRPTALGKKNGLFFGEAGAGGRGAILSTVIESCRRREIDPHAYIKDVLTRLPSMSNRQLVALLTENWRPVHTPALKATA